MSTPNLIEAARNMWDTYWLGERVTGRKYGKDMEALRDAVSACPKDAVVVSRALLLEVASTLKVDAEYFRSVSAGRASLPEESLVTRLLEAAGETE